MEKRVTRRKEDGDLARLSDRRWTAGDARRVLSAWKTSGVSLAAFARRHGLTAQRIAWWRERLKEPARESSKRVALRPTVQFVPAVVRDVGASAQSRGAAVTIRVRDEVGVEILDPARVPVEWVSALIRRCEDPAP